MSPNLTHAQRGFWTRLSALEPRLSDEIAALLVVQLGCTFQQAQACCRAAIEKVAPQYETLRARYRELQSEAQGDDPASERPPPCCGVAYGCNQCNGVGF